MKNKWEEENGRKVREKVLEPLNSFSGAAENGRKENVPNGTREGLGVGDEV